MEFGSNKKNKFVPAVRDPNPASSYLVDPDQQRLFQHVESSFMKDKNVRLRLFGILAGVDIQEYQGNKTIRIALEVPEQYWQDFFGIASMDVVSNPGQVPLKVRPCFTTVPKAMYFPWATYGSKVVMVLKVDDENLLDLVQDPNSAGDFLQGYSVAAWVSITTWRFNTGPMAGMAGVSIKLKNPLEPVEPKKPQEPHPIS